MTFVLRRSTNGNLWGAASRIPKQKGRPGKAEPPPVVISTDQVILE
jgi:hypothetical protein